MLTDIQIEADDEAARNFIAELFPGKYIGVYSEHHVHIGAMELTTRGSYEKLLAIAKLIKDQEEKP